MNIALENAVYYVEAWAVSYSVLLDLQPMKRSFQTKGQTFQEIAEDVIKGAGAVMKFHAPEQSVEHIMLQYNETDWQFVKR